MNGYKNSCDRGFETREEVDDDYSKFVVKEKSRHGVGKGAGHIGLSRLNDFIIFVQSVVVVYLLLS